MQTVIRDALAYHSILTKFHLMPPSRYTAIPQNENTTTSHPPTPEGLYQWVLAVA